MWTEIIIIYLKLIGLEKNLFQKENRNLQSYWLPVLT